MQDDPVIGPWIARVALVLLGLALLAAAPPARAQSCSFAISDVAFGQVDTLSGAAADTTATVSITCGGAPLGAQARICLNFNAGNGGSSGSTRLMRSGPDTLAYQLYQDPAYAETWGSVEEPQFGEPVTVDLVLPILSGSVSTTRTIYARVLPGQQLAAPGTYFSVFAGSHVRFNHLFHTGIAPPCSAISANLTRPNYRATATISPNCLVSAQDINFGPRGVLDSNVDATGAVEARCTPGTPFAIGLNGGLANGTPTTRRMTLAGNSILYGLYRNSARTQPWGDEPANRQAGEGTGLAQNFSVYGRVPPQPTPPPGTYSDTVVVTVRY